jgi:hypothetical protein
MATVINNPSNGGSDGGNGMGMVIGGLILLAAIALFIFYGLPMIRNTASPKGGNGINVEVPKDVNVNVNPPGGQ